MLELGKETPVTVDGKPWIVGRLTIGALEEFRDWIKAQVGDPFEGLAELVKVLPKEDAMELVKEAREVKQQLREFSMQTPICKTYMATESGASRLVLALLKPHHPQATIEDAFAVVQALGDKMPKVIADAHGEVPAGPAPNP